MAAAEGRRREDSPALFSTERDEIIFKMSFPFKHRRLLDSPLCPFIVKGHGKSRKKLLPWGR